MSDPQQEPPGLMGRDDLPQRRASDIDPAVQLAIDHGDSDVRHWARNEIGVALLKVSEVGAKVDAAALESTREHAEVKAHLGQMSREQSETKAALVQWREHVDNALVSLQRQVTELQTTDRETSAAAAAVEKLSSRVYRAAGAVTAAMAVGVAILALVLN